MSGPGLCEVTQTRLHDRSEMLPSLRLLSCVLMESDERGRELLRRVIAEDCELTLVGESCRASEGCALVKAHKPDLLLLGLELPGSNGFDILGALSKAGGPNPEVIFISECAQHALQALDAAAAGYLLKPLDENRVRRVLMVAKERAQRKLQATSRANEVAAIRTSRIAVKSEGRIIFLRLDAIDWVESMRNYLLLHVGTNKYRIRERLHSLDGKLRPHLFVRIHRSTIVNINRIREVKRWYTGEYIVRLDTGKELTLSKTFRDQFFAVTSARPA
jgi:two-component system, LytTR family, response regulator